MKFYKDGVNCNLNRDVTELYGFYELDVDGTVLYRHARRGAPEMPESFSPVGSNLFTDVLIACRNAEKLRFRFSTFVSAKITTDSFLFGCELSGQINALRIQLVRVFKIFPDGVADEKTIYYLNIQPELH